MKTFRKILTAILATVAPKFAAKRANNSLKKSLRKIEEKISEIGQSVLNTTDEKRKRNYQHILLRLLIVRDYMSSIIKRIEAIDAPPSKNEHSIVSNAKIEELFKEAGMTQKEAELF